MKGWYLNSVDKVEERELVIEVIVIGKYRVGYTERKTRMTARIERFFASTTHPI